MVNDQTSGPVANPATLDQAKAEINKAADEFKSEVIDVSFEGCEFKVDTSLLDDVDALEMIDSIENQDNMKAIVDFLKYLVGETEYERIRDHFVKRDGRFRITVLSKIYVAIFDKFDPKG